VLGTVDLDNIGVSGLELHQFKWLGNDALIGSQGNDLVIGGDGNDLALIGLFLGRARQHDATGGFLLLFLAANHNTMV
jgi:Ca2+-binding RTX toxin-like protein